MPAYPSPRLPARRGLPRRAFLFSCAGPLLAAQSAAAAPSRSQNYTREPFDYGGISLDVWSRAGGPLVFILHEMTGLTEDCFILGDDLHKQGFSVVIPHFFGDFGGWAAGFIKACSPRSLFNCYGEDDYGKIMPWIKALAHYKSGSDKFGAIGNCMTGALPLLMMRSKRCVAPVLCQPAFPFSRRFNTADPGSLGLPPVDLEFAALRASRDGVPILAIRYQRDKLCPPERFCRLRTAFPIRLHCMELPESPDPHNAEHSTLIGHRSPAAFETVVGFLGQQLQGKVWIPPADTGSCSA